MRPAAVLVFAALVALLGAGAAQPRTAATAVTKEQLAVMVVPKSQLGSLGSGLEIALGSGVADNATAAATSLDPKDTGSQLARAGRLTGYSLTYSDPALNSLVRRSGVASIGTSVSLLTSPSAADAYLTEGIAVATRYAGKDVGQTPLHIDEVGVNAVRSLGERAASLIEVSRLGNARLYSTSIVFRTGSLFAAVTITRADAKPALDDALRIAQKLARRIGLAQSGGLHEPPVPVPATAEQGQAPAGAPPLPAMALSVADLQPGAHVVRQGYVADDSAIGRYERQFSAARLDDSTLTGLDSAALLFRSFKEAKGAFRQLELIYGSSAAERLFTSRLGGSVHLEAKKEIRAGDDGFASAYRASASGHELRLVQIVVRVGPVVGVARFAGQASSLQFEDVPPLLARFARRIRDGL